MVLSHMRRGLVRHGGGVVTCCHMLLQAPAATSRPTRLVTVSIAGCHGGAATCCSALATGARRPVDALKKHWTGATWLTAGPRTAAQLLKVTSVTFIRDEQIRNTAFRKTTGQAISEGEVRATSDLTQTREDMNCNRCLYGICVGLIYWHWKLGLLKLVGQGGWVIGHSDSNVSQEVVSLGCAVNITWAVFHICFIRKAVQTSGLHWIANHLVDCR